MGEPALAAALVNLFTPGCHRAPHWVGGTNERTTKRLGGDWD
jgi:hypothetical protein